MRLSKKTINIVFTIYLILLFLFVIIKIQDDFTSRFYYIAQGNRWGYRHINLTPFTTISSQINMLQYSGSTYFMLNSVLNLGANILAFIPLGFFLPNYIKKHTFFLSLLSFLTIILFFEIFQHLTWFGFFDIDDIILNLLGCLLGYGLQALCFKYKWIRIKKEN